MATARVWRERLYRVVSHPAFEVTVVVAILLLAGWALVTTEAFQRAPLLVGR